MTKKQLITNMLAINSCSTYYLSTNMRYRMRAKVVNDHEIWFYEADHTKPDSKKVIDFKKGLYHTYENKNWQDQTKPIEWILHSSFRILDFNHMNDGICECPVEEDKCPLLNQEKKGDTIYYVQYLYKNPNASFLNGIRRVSVDEKQNVEKQLIEVGKKINGYPRWCRSSKEVAKQIKEFNAGKFKLCTKYALYETTNEANFNIVMPEVLFEGFNNLLKTVGFNYKWKKSTGDKIWEYKDNKNSLPFACGVMRNWQSRGGLDTKWSQFVDDLPPIAKNFIFQTRPEKKITDYLDKRADESEQEYTIRVKDKDQLAKVQQIFYSHINTKEARLSKFDIYMYTDGRMSFCISFEEYDKKTKKWNNRSGFTMSPVNTSNSNFITLGLIADVASWQRTPASEKFIQNLVNVAYLWIQNFKAQGKFDSRAKRDAEQFIALASRQNSEPAFLQHIQTKKIYFLGFLPNHMPNIKKLILKTFKLLKNTDPLIKKKPIIWSAYWDIIDLIIPDDK